MKRVRDNDRPPVNVAGVGGTGPVARDMRSIPEMVHRAVEQALADAQLDHSDIDSVVTASVDLFDGLTASNIAVTEVVGAVMKPETRIAADGLCAVLHAACQIWSGTYDNVLVVAHGKASMAPYFDLTGWAMDPITLQPLGVDFLVCAGLQAHSAAIVDPSASERWANIAATRRTAAAEVEGLAESYGAHDVAASRVVASPITHLMCAPLADAACAVVLRRTGAPSARGVSLTGIGHDLDAHQLGDRDIGRWTGLERALDRARRVASLGESDRFDLYEPSCWFAHEEDLFAHATRPDESSVVSPTGGLFGGAAPVAAGLSRLIDATRRMRGDDGVERALAHGTWGPCGQGHAVAILEATS